MNPLVGMGATIAGGSVAKKIGGRAPKVFNTGLKLLSVPGTIATGVQAIGGTVDSYKDAVKNNQYHDKLNKTAAEKDDDKKKELKKKILKATPYMAAGAAILTYGSQALKDKSLTKPIKDAAKSIPEETAKQAIKKTKIVKGVVKGAKDSIKKGNTIVINKSGKQSLFNRLAQGAAWGTGVLGVHLLGDKYLKNKELVEKSYNSAQPAAVKVVKKGGEVVKTIKDSKEEREKTAAEGNFNWKNVYEKGVKDVAATAIPMYFANEIAGKIRRSAQDIARRKADNEYYDRIRKKKESKDGEEKTASLKSMGTGLLNAGKTLVKDPKSSAKAIGESVRKFHNKYSEDIATQGAKTITRTLATVPIILGHEYLKEKSKNRKKEKEYEERAKRREEDNYQRRDNNGRNYKGGKKYYNSKPNLSISEKRGLAENGGTVRD